MTLTTALAHGTVRTADLAPFHGFDSVLHGDPAAGVSWLRTTSARGGTLLAGVFTAQPSTFRYTFGADESLHVVAGDVTIELDSGGSVRLRAGDIASFAAGETSTWTVHEALRKFFVISG